MSPLYPRGLSKGYLDRSSCKLATGSDVNTEPADQLLERCSHLTCVTEWRYSADKILCRSPRTHSRRYTIL